MYPYIDKNKCTECLVCVEVCPYEVFSEKNGKSIVSNPEECIECGECIRNCDYNAIKLIE